MNKINISRIYALLDAYQSGILGGEKMPEDENPALEKNTKENYVYFTLPMALNYQRNSYTLWESANKTYRDESTKDVFDTHVVINMPEQELRNKLLKYKVAMQPNKQPIIWKTVCETIENDFAGDIRKLFISNGYSVQNITVAPDTHIIQASEKLGVISSVEAGQSNVQSIVAERWKDILEGTELVPIDLHTPMWLWSRGRFKIDI